MIRISIIIPTLNEAENIDKLVLFFSNLQHIEVAEIIIADSPLSIKSYQVSAENFRLNYITTQGQGRALQMNEGATHANGDIFAFLHADVIPPQSFIKDVSDAVAEGYHFGFFGYNFDRSSFMMRLNSRFTFSDGIFAGGGDQIHFMTRSLFDSMGGYDPSYSIMEDFDFVRRYRRLNRPFKIIQNPATVSARKYRYNSWFVVNLLNLAAFSMFLSNVSPDRIKRMYTRFLHL